mmetsp:Transcript_1049/g.3197  ORF Transcript_1049/g.3197 Transcript_1049/m.3197 type:complete len:285 (-) Transcript_1049:4452-5306(-)
MPPLIGGLLSSLGGCGFCLAQLIQLRLQLLQLPLKGRVRITKSRLEGSPLGRCCCLKLVTLLKGSSCSSLRLGDAGGMLRGQSGCLPRRTQLRLLALQQHMRPRLVLSQLPRSGSSGGLCLRHSLLHARRRLRLDGRQRVQRRRRLLGMRRRRRSGFCCCGVCLLLVFRQPLNLALHITHRLFDPLPLSLLVPLRLGQRRACSLCRRVGIAPRCVGGGGGFFGGGSGGARLCQLSSLRLQLLLDNCQLLQELFLRVVLSTASRGGLGGSLSGGGLGGGSSLLSF